MASLSQRAPGVRAGVLAGLYLVLTVLLASGAGQEPTQEPERTRAVPATTDAGSAGCLVCHSGIERMHPGSLSCVACHGGDATAAAKSEAHVAPSAAVASDERVAPRDRDLAWRRFRNPMDLRVAAKTCGGCHDTDVEHLLVSLHGTTAGHLSDGYYEMGLFGERGSRYAVFPVSGAPLSGGEVEHLNQVPAFEDRLPRDELATHYTDLARKECMQCHLWSGGRAVRGRVGFDGDYRGEGCAACHVTYARDGLSESGDRTVKKGEPGHPLFHSMTRAPSTATCTSCHYGDASVGLHFRGLSQLPPGAPGGPDIPGTTDTQLNRVFYLDDPAICPPDVHQERGMHCIDCHTQSDVMGDGKLHGQMEHAVEISCSACHGTFDEPATLETERGTPLEHLRREGESVILTSKVDGRQHPVPQAVHVLDPDRPEYNWRAVEAMSSVHANVECYTCHAGWNVNFLGFHFSRIEGLTQLDLVSGKRTSGRVTTQEKVFATWKSFYAGLNERGAVAPYLTGFSTMGSVWDADGELVLDQELPETAAGLSGMTMIHHQLHSTRPTARSCVECHRTSATWGLGSPNFRLARQLAFVADRRGIEVVALNRGELSRSAPLTKIPLSDVVDLEILADDLQGHARFLFAAEGGRGVHVLDVSNPTRPRRAAFVATIDPRGLELAGDQLYVADGIGGLRVFDVSEPEAMHEVGRVPTFDAHDVDVKWPWAYVADGPGGLVIVDIRAPIAPAVISALDLGTSQLADEAIAVESLFQYSRPIAVEDEPIDKRTRARNLCTVLDRRRGPILVDVTEPRRPKILFPRDSLRSTAREGLSGRGLVLLSQVDPAEAQGGVRTAERDYAYVLWESDRGATQRSTVLLMDVSDPLRPGRRRPTAIPAGYAAEQLVAADFYSPPFRRRILFAPGNLGVYMSDVTTSSEPTQIGLLPGIDDAYAIAVEEFPLDRMLDESGRPLKDVSHAGSRWLYRSEIEGLLSLAPEEIGTHLDYERLSEVFGATARLHLEELDADGSGHLEGEEYEAAGGAALDDDGDGRIVLLELARNAGLLGVEPERSAVTPTPASARVFEDGDLARLLDGLDPFAFDRDHDGQLQRREARAAFFAALDLDGDQRLTPDELSRCPGELRELRYGDARARELFETLEKTRDGRISAREFRLGEAEWAALDADASGAVRIDAGAYEFQRERGYVARDSEWPTRRLELYTLPPGITAELLLEEFDANADGELEKKEMRKRAELHASMDRNGNGVVVREELDRVLTRVTQRGVDALADDFEGRWDLDGSGSIELDELPAGVRLRLAPHLEGE